MGNILSCENIPVLPLNKVDVYFNILESNDELDHILMFRSSNKYFIVRSEQLWEIDKEDLHSLLDETIFIYDDSTGNQICSTTDPKGLNILNLHSKRVTKLCDLNGNPFTVLAVIENTLSSLYIIGKYSDGRIRVFDTENGNIAVIRSWHPTLAYYHTIKYDDRNLDISHNYFTDPGKVLTILKTVKNPCNQVAQHLTANCKFTNCDVGKLMITWIPSGSKWYPIVTDSGHDDVYIDD